MKKRLLLAGFFVLLVPVCALADGQPALNTGDTAWMLVATALVMLMTPTGLSLFYGGMTQRKNILNTIGMSVAVYSLISVLWILFAFHLSFGTGNSLIGDVKFFLSGIKTQDVGFSSFNTILAGSDIAIPSLLFVLYQMTFAAITVALISGAVIERLKFSTWLIFSALWVVLVYSPVAHWIWGGGFMASMGVLDFAGGIVVHVTAGISSLVVVLMLGKRKEYGVMSTLPSSVTLTVIGAMLLWFGWFGFNAGSAVASNGLAVSSFLITNTAGALGALTWMVIEWITTKKPTLIGIASGAIAGLAAITPASGFVGLDGAFIIGIGGGIVGFLGVSVLKKKFNYDDSLDAFGVHGLCGIWGSIMVGVLANPEVNSMGKGLLYGNPIQLLIQLKGVGITIVFSAVLTFVIYKFSSLITRGARVDGTVEKIGLDEAVHGEKGFHL
ncbi:MAG TPA: ammonia channel protein [Spirochaetia bacterium]|nr:ammonia channel protein [Spirochaetia bacterium]